MEDNPSCCGARVGAIHHPKRGRASADTPRRNYFHGGAHACQASREELQGTRAQLNALLDQPEEQKDEPKTCVVCYDETPNVALIPCGHMCMCSGCTSNLEQAARVAQPRGMNREEARRWRQERLPTSLPKCPVCRQVFTETLRIYA